MTSLNFLLLIGASLLFVGLLLGSLSVRFGVPSLLMFLLVGMFAGEDGPLGLEFSNLETGYLVSNIALAVILLDGGMRTRLATFRIGLQPALTLATLGVALTAGLVGAFATWLLDLDWRLGLLLGGIIGSTDAAAVFNVIQGAGLRLNERVASTLEIESGLNDPMAIFITVLLIQLLLNPDSLSATESAIALVRQFGIGAILGVAAGAVLAELLLRLRSNEGLYALLLCSGGASLFALTGELGGSGFLAVYLAGVIAGNRGGGVGDNVLRSMDSLAWLAQSGMFLLLGLLVTPSALNDHGGYALLIALFLIFLARPLAVWLCLLPFPFSWREKFFVSWTGLRGAVPIVLAMFPLLAGIEQTRLLFDVTFVVVLASLLIQGTSMGAIARWLRVALPASTEPLQVTAFSGSKDQYLMQFRVADGARVTNDKFSEINNNDFQAILVLRDNKAQPLDEQLRIQPNDRITWLTSLAEKERLADMCQSITPSIKRFYGDFTVRGDVLVTDVLAAYGVGHSDPIQPTLTVSQLFQRRAGRPVIGDTLMIGGLRLRVRAVQGKEVLQVGIRLPR
ncbi:MAG: potassium/proton antiporter [Gammaproteobacteria bacterium]|nr:potassium/proton antiporter [Gammaproteobacteria bacterium]MBQ0774393.1 potassium/proton antiporter [Gammaproteobacteria bacterium]